jgi:hypothetical protein
VKQSSTNFLHDHDNRYSVLGLGFNCHSALFSTSGNLNDLQLLSVVLLDLTIYLSHGERRHWQLIAICNLASLFF